MARPKRIIDVERPSSLEDYKEALLRPPVALEIILSFNSFALGIGILEHGFPSYLSAYANLIPTWVWYLYFMYSGLTFLIGFNQNFIGRYSRIINTVSCIFLWSWLTIGALSSEATSVFAYVMLSPPLSCLWVLAHLLVPAHNKEG